MFHGDAKCTVDDKSRIIFPAKFRKDIKTHSNNKLILTRGLDGCILVYPYIEWEKIEKKLAKLNTFDPKKRFFLRKFMPYVNECELDSQNRLLIPQQLKEFAKLENEVMVLGMVRTIEIWNPNAKAKYDESYEIGYEQVSEMISPEFEDIDE